MEKPQHQGNGHLLTGLSHISWPYDAVSVSRASPSGYLPTAPMFCFRLPWSFCLQNHRSAGVWPSCREMKWSLAGGSEPEGVARKMPTHSCSPSHHWDRLP